MLSYSTEDEPIEGARYLEEQAMCHWLDGRADALKGFYPRNEEAAWSEKRDAAVAYLADVQSPAPGILADEVGDRPGKSVAALAVKVVTKAHRLEKVVSLISRARDVAQESRAAAQTRAEVIAANEAAAAAFDAEVAALLAALSPA